MAGEFFGPYRVGTRLGRGGMGEVHEAFDTHRERTVALKRLHGEDKDDPDVRERFRRESRIAARLDSPHVVPIHDFGVIDGRMYIDMRLVRGRDLGALVAAEGGLAPARAVQIVEQTADALDAAHQAGIVHRDVKPSNVLLAARDFVYLADFGIVHVREATEQPRLTATGSTLGTPAYMAPEQLRGDPFDQRLDVYALGCVLFEALTGRPPFVGERMVVMLSHLNDTPPRPSSLAPLPAGLDDVVLTALAKDPAKRFPTTGALAAAAAEVIRRDARAAESLTEQRTFETTPARPAPPRIQPMAPRATPPAQPRSPAPPRPAPPVHRPLPDDRPPGPGADVTGPIPRPVVPPARPPATSSPRQRDRQRTRVGRLVVLGDRHRGRLRADRPDDGPGRHDHPRTRAPAHQLQGVRHRADALPAPAARRDRHRPTPEVPQLTRAVLEATNSRYLLHALEHDEATRKRLTGRIHERLKALRVKLVRGGLAERGARLTPAVMVDLLLAGGAITRSHLRLLDDEARLRAQEAQWWDA